MHVYLLIDIVIIFHIHFLLAWISPTDWKPFFSPIKFPSAKFLDKHQKRIQPSSDREERNRKLMSHSEHLPHNRNFDKPKVPDLQKHPHLTYQEL